MGHVLPVIYPDRQTPNLSSFFTKFGITENKCLLSGSSKSTIIIPSPKKYSDIISY